LFGASLLERSLLGLGAARLCALSRLIAVEVVKRLGSYYLLERALGFSDPFSMLC